MTQAGNSNSISGLFCFPDTVKKGTIHWNTENGLITEFTEAAGPDPWPESCLIFPGFIDVHIHSRDDVSKKETYKEDFKTLSLAALNGGVSHVADMPNNPCAPINDESYQAKEALLSVASIGITLYAGIGPETRPLRRHVPYKAYMGPSVGDLFFSNQEDLDRVLEHYQGRHVSFHCEDPVILEDNKHQPTHELKRPPSAEIVSTRFALDMIRKHQLIGKLCHYSTREGLEMIKAAKKDGLPVTCEVTPHHLFFDESMLNDDNRVWLQMNPPLRSAEDREALLKALKEEHIDYLATDHAPHTTEEKLTGVSGVPHLDTYGSFVAWLINEKQFTPQDILKFCCQKPAHFLKPFLDSSYGQGIGSLQPGYRADFTVLDLKENWIPKKKDLQTKCAWSPFENINLPGKVKASIIGGQRRPC